MADITKADATVGAGAADPDPIRLDFLDPWGNRVEHWADGDLLNRASGTDRAPVSIAMGRQWGPTVPEPAKK